MAKFYGDLTGDDQKTKVTRSAEHQLRGHIRGWNFGCHVRIRLDNHGDEVVEIWLTGGSNDPERRRYIGTYGKPITIGKGG